MFLSGMVEIPRPFDRAQGMFQVKRRSVMSAPDQSRGQAPAGIQGGEGVAIGENLDSRFRGKDGRGSRLPVDIVQIPRLRATGC
jgi:hypothetical protein